MAELMLKVGDKPRAVDWKDGDVICALSDNRIQCCHAAHICFEKNPATRKFAALTDDLLLPDAHVSRDFLEAVCRWRFERISSTEIDRVEISSGDRVRIDATPRLIDGQLQHMHVPRFIERRKAALAGSNSTGLPMYGTAGSEVWYGGPQDYSPAAVSAVWDAIETKTPHRRTDAARQLWPAGRLDLQHHLLIRVDPFDEPVRHLLESAVIDEGAIDPAARLVARRRFFVDWQNALGFTGRQRLDVQDRSLSVELRESQSWLRSAIVSDKGAA